MKIGVAGCAGRMGRMVVRTLLQSPGCALAGALDHAGHPAIGTDAGLLAGGEPTGIAVTADVAALFSGADAVIDFSVAEATPAHAAAAAETGTSLVIGTTALSPAHLQALDAAAAQVPVVQAANMSVGVTLLLELTRRVAAVLGDDYDIEITEMHHRNKVDAPSGTALALGRAAAAGRGRQLDAVAQRVRDGLVGARARGAIGFATLRGGDVVGEHTVIFAGDGERIELTHRAGSREVFARGAVRAALWTAARPAGLYSMRDVLGMDARND
jgi:4-hydroxy-tetrahydrodipicolinate reductase